MDRRLVDAARPFSIIYSLYHHEYLNCLISANVVQIMPNGQLSFAHQGLYEDNMEQFACNLDEKDREIILLTDQLRPKKLIKRFGGDPKDEHKFFTQKFTGQLQTLMLDFIQKRMAKILPLLEDRHFYSMANDGYPARKPIGIAKEKVDILFHFIPDEDMKGYARYFPTIRQGDTIVKFIYKGAILPCEQPAWLLVEDTLYSFNEYLDGKKLKPFLKKAFIRISPERQEEYYTKFAAQLIENYQVRSRCFPIRTFSHEPDFILQINAPDSQTFSFTPQVNYGRFGVDLKMETKYKVVMEKEENNGFVFFRIVRDFQAEQAVKKLLKEIEPNPGSLTPWEYVDREEGLIWLSKFSEQLKENGVRIIQTDAEQTINLGRPEIELVTTDAGDWFDIKAIVTIGNFKIPFLKFRKYILSGKREYRLPDKTICILPEQWFSDYRHLLEVSEVKDDELRIRKYQAPLLNFPSQSDSPKMNLMAILNGKAKPPVIPAPKGLKADLRVYQQEGFNWLCFLKDNGISGILADDMGLGKTLQTLALLQHVKEEGNTTPSLAVVPTSLIHNWRNEAAKFTPDIKVYIHTGVNRSRDLAVFQGYDLILTSYGIIRQDLEVLETFPFHYLILDESQMIKNPSSKTSKAIKKLVARHRLSLTGTPIENTVMDIWSQMAFLNPGLLGGEGFFKKFYVTPIERTKDPNRMAKLRRIIYPFILRRRKRQVEKELPPKVERLHFCGMEEKQQELYEETRSQYRNYLLQLVNTGTYRKNKLNLLTGLQRLRQIAIHPKLVEKEDFDLKQSGKYLEVKRLLKSVIAKRSKVLIFSQFVKMLHLLRDDLIEEGIVFNYLDGSTRDRQAQVDTFQNDKNISVFLISLKAGGVGLNLTAADYVFILDPWWNPAVENQAVDRSHRIGQKKTVFYYKFITQDTIEEKILGLQARKAKLSEDIIAIEEDIYKNMDEVDFEDLLK